ncbi:hypothetical protein H0A65_05315 [Alcaligenaceae bacterium]|nr:hypothetical protein [Alcaligenaceae bacterium]
MEFVGERLGLGLASLPSFLSGKRLELTLNGIKLIEVFDCLLGHWALARFIQIKQAPARMRHAANLGNTLLEAGFISTVVVADQFSAPVAQEGPGMSTATPFGKVVNDTLKILEDAGGIGPQIRTMGLFAPRLQYLHGCFVSMHHWFVEDGLAQGIDQRLETYSAHTHPFGKRGTGDFHTGSL